MEYCLPRRLGKAPFSHNDDGLHAMRPSSPLQTCTRIAEFNGEDTAWLSQDRLGTNAICSKLVLPLGLVKWSLTIVGSTDVWHLSCLDIHDTDLVSIVVLHMPLRLLLKPTALSLKSSLRPRTSESIAWQRAQSDAMTMMPTVRHSCGPCRVCPRHMNQRSPLYLRLVSLGLSVQRKSCKR